MSLEQRVRRILKAKLRRQAERVREAMGGAFDSHDEEEEFGESSPPSRADDREARCRRLLEVSADATTDEIRKAYRQLCKKYHPDRFVADESKRAAATELLTEINAAYEFLTRSR